MTIHFMCRGNAFRSVIAETYLKSLGLENINVISSGSVAEAHRKQNISLFAAVQALLSEHGIEEYAKTYSDQATQELINKSDIVVCMNQRVVDEAKQTMSIPPHVMVWDITDVSESEHAVHSDTERDEYLEEVYQKIRLKVDELVSLMRAKVLT